MARQKNLLGALAILAVFFGGGCMPTVNQTPTHIEQPSSPPPNGSTASKTITSDFGHSFIYPATYVVTEQKLTDSDTKANYTDKGFDRPQDQYTLIQESEIRPEGFIGEGPPSINVAYWTNEKKLSLVDWGKRNRLYSGFHEGAPITTEETVKGMKAIRYTSDGLYAFEHILIEYNGGVLALDVATEPSHPNAETFDVILKNLEFKK